jgi:hypothetical protein
VVGGFSEASHWWKNANLMMADRDVADRGSPQGLLKHRRSPASSTAILTNQTKSFKRVHVSEKPTVDNKKGTLS